MQHIEKFLNYLKFEKRFSNNTLISYKTDINQFSDFIQEHFNCTNPENTDYQIVRKWIIHLIDNKITNRSVNRKLSTLRKFYKYLLIEKLIESNPLDKISSPRISKRLPSFVEEKQMDILLDEIEFGDDFKGQRNKLIIEMFYFTGMRLSELINLLNNDIDFHTNAIKVIGKGNKERMIPISKEFNKKLQDYINYKIKNGIAALSSGYFFVNNKGLKLYPKAVYRIINSYLRLITSTDKKSPHVIRHTFATHMLNHGADLNAIKELLGHANLSATQVYTHNTFEKLIRIYKQAHPRA